MPKLLPALLPAVPCLALAAAPVPAPADGYRVVEMPAVFLDPDGVNFVTVGVLAEDGDVWINVGTLAPSQDHDVFTTQRCSDSTGCVITAPRNRSHFWRGGRKGHFAGASFSDTGKEWQARKLKGQPMERLWRTTSGGALAINAAGTVVGSAESRPVVFDTALRVLPDLGGGQGEARDIDDQGVVVGASVTAQGGSCAVKWVNLRIDASWCPPSGWAWAGAIGAAGTVVGQSSFAQTTPPHAARFEADGSVVDLGALAPAALSQSLAMAVNRFGQVVGWSNDAAGGGGRAVRFDTAGVVDLNLQISPADQARYRLAYAKAINDAGQIMVAAVLKADPEKTVVLRLDPMAAGSPARRR